MGVSEYQIATSVPENLRGSLPSIAELEAGLACGENPTGTALPSSTSAAPPEGGSE
jgi:hypothetical protein